MTRTSSILDTKMLLINPMQNVKNIMNYEKKGREENLSRGEYNSEKKNILAEINFTSIWQRKKYGEERLTPTHSWLNPSHSSLTLVS